ncbi:hypothetical protein Leryth_019202 [Lithospermum erythrorhizon]|nr:hypothetical protein Leryth_019202 [Lithospermum erythrorhizon]
MNQSSWVNTFVIQVFLCLAFYLVFQIGQPQKANPHRMNKIKVQKNFLDFHFVSVASSPRPLQEYTLLFKQLEKVIKMYNVQFVINISEDPLLMNVTTFLQHPEVLLHTTRSLEGQGPVYYQKKIDLPHGRTLDGPAQKNQFSSLTKILKGSQSDWHIAIGYHSLVNCSVDGEKSDELASTLLNTGVNAYISLQTCLTYVPKEGSGEISSGDVENEGLSFTFVNPNLIPMRENVDGFVLHRISALEFISYLVNIKGDVRTVALQPKGRDVM